MRSFSVTLVRSAVNISALSKSEGDIEGYSQRTMTMFVGVVALRYQHHTTQCCVVLITKCHNFHKHSHSPLTTMLLESGMNGRLEVTQFSVPTISGTVSVTRRDALCNTFGLTAPGSLNPYPMGKGQVVTQ